MRQRLALLIIVCATLMLAGVSPVRAGNALQSAPKIAMTATAGYGDTGAYLIGEWLPIRVTLTNPQGGESKRVRVQVVSNGYVTGQIGGAYEREIDLPAPSRKEITLYSYDGSYARFFQVKLFDGDKELDTITVNGDPYEPPNNMIIGVVSSDSSLLNILKGEQVGHVVEALTSSFNYYAGVNPPVTAGTGSAIIAHMALADIPTLSQALDNLGAIVLDDVDTGSLSEVQRAALEGWVARGGTLVATFRQGGGDTLAGLGDLPPVKVSGLRTVPSLASVGDLVNTALTASAVAVGNAELKSGPLYSSRVLAISEGTPLLVVRDLGQGQVVYLGLSPSLPPLKGWEGTMPLVKRILVEHDLTISYGASMRAGTVAGFNGGMSMFGTAGGLFALPGLQLPDPWLIGGFLLLYIIIVGPINFIVLRRMRRAEMAWITIPVLVAVFSVVAYSLALGSKGNDLIAIRANAFQTTEGIEQASLFQYFGLYSPARRTYSFDLNTDGVLTEVSPYGYYQPSSTGNVSPVLGGNGTTSLRNVNIDTWSLRGFLAQDTARLSSPLEADLHLGDNKIVGKVKNRTNGPLEDVVLIRGRATQYVGYMAPGETRDVNLEVSANPFDASSPQTFLPPPPGVSAPQGPYYYGSGGNANNQAQRLYDRKIELLSTALYSLVSGEPPTDISVTMVAWGPGSSTQFGVAGYNTSGEEVNVWTGTTQVRASDSDQPVMGFQESGTVPFTLYAPGNNPPLLPMGKSPGVPGAGQPYYVNPSGGLPAPVPTATPLPGQTGSTSGFRAAPYADLQFRLPSGTRPASLTFGYNLRDVGQNDDLDLLAYNVETGRWDKIASLVQDQPTTNIVLPNPVQYSGTGGDVTLRLLSTAGQTAVDGSFALALNSDGGR